MEKHHPSKCSADIAHQKGQEHCDKPVRIYRKEVLPDLSQEAAILSRDAFQGAFLQKFCILTPVKKVQDTDSNDEKQTHPGKCLHVFYQGMKLCMQVPAIKDCNIRDANLEDAEKHEKTVREKRETSRMKSVSQKGTKRREILICDFTDSRIIDDLVFFA